MILILFIITNGFTIILAFANGIIEIKQFCVFRLLIKPDPNQLILTFASCYQSYPKGAIHSWALIGQWQTKASHWWKRSSGRNQVTKILQDIKKQLLATSLYFHLFAPYIK